MGRTRRAGRKYQLRKLFAKLSNQNSLQYSYYDPRIIPEISSQQQSIISDKANSPKNCEDPSLEENQQTDKTPHTPANYKLIPITLNISLVLTNNAPISDPRCKGK